MEGNGSVLPAPDSAIQFALAAAPYRWYQRVLDPFPFPAVAIWVFLSQCLSTDHSFRDAVAGLIAWRLARGLKACSANTGAYCTARDDLPEETCIQLMRGAGRQTDAEAPPQWRWLGHRVLDVDRAQRDFHPAITEWLGASRERKPWVPRR